MTRARAVALCLASLLGCAPQQQLAAPTPPECDAACQAQAKPAECVSTQDYFDDLAWPVLEGCASCHVSGGQSAGTRLVFKPSVIPDYLRQNYVIFAEASALREGGASLLLLKATGSVPHGGGAQLEAGSRDYAVLLSMIEQLAAPIECPAIDSDGDGIPDAEEPQPGDVPAPLPVSTGLVLGDNYAVLRKATIALGGRLPTGAEMAAVEGQPFTALTPILDALMTERAFYERVREIMNDVLLTDRSREETGYLSIMSELSGSSYGGAFPGAAEFLTADNTGNTNARLVKTADAFAREPLEFFVYAAKNDLPLSAVLTSQFRLVNAYTAKALNVPWGAVMPAEISDVEATDYDDFRPTALPGINEAQSGATFSEYAGLLTTNSYIRRYPNTCTNHNRKLARYTYRFFLDFDIMKNAPRLDLSTVDVSAHPSRNNPQCTGCHAQIDPVAGAFMNWTRCFSSPPRHYTLDDKGGSCGAAGWYPDAEMFPPGVGAGAANQLSPGDKPKALERLAAHIVTQPGFDRAMVRHFFVGLTGRPMLEAPQDVSTPGYANLDAAFEAQQDSFDALVADFVAGGRRLKPLIKAIVATPYFRAVNAEASDRVELKGMGGGVWLPPEVLHRKLTAVLGAPWIEIFQNSPVYRARADGLLLQRYRMRLFWGGIDSDAVLTRQQLPGGLSAAGSERMALEMACEHTARDFARAPSDRRLFRYTEVAQVPSGDRADPSQAGIVQTLQHLHERVLGERLGANDPELIASYELLSSVRAAGAAAVGAGQVPATLDKLCGGHIDLYTGAGAATAAPNDAAFVLRAWQAVLSYMLMDYRFLFD